MEWMDAVSACRGLAAEVWQGQRDRALWEADGLNAEDVVRHRLRGVVQDILRESGLRREAYAALISMDVVRDGAVDVLAASEAEVLLPGHGEMWTGPVTEAVRQARSYSASRG